MLRNCPPGFERSLKTKKCIKICPSHLKRNLDTGRCVRKTVYTPLIDGGPTSNGPFTFVPPSQEPTAVSSIEPSLTAPVAMAPAPNSVSMPMSKASSLTEPSTASPWLTDTPKSRRRPTPTVSSPPSLGMGEKQNWIDPNIYQPLSGTENPYANVEYTNIRPNSMSMPSLRQRSSMTKPSPASPWLTDTPKSGRRPTPPVLSSSPPSLGMGEKQAWIDPNIYQPLPGTENPYANVEYTNIRPNSMSMPSLRPVTPSITIDSKATDGSNRSSRSVTSMNTQSVQRQIDDLDDKLEKLSAVYSEDHQHLSKLDQVVRTGARPNFVLIGYNKVEEGKHEPVFAKTVGQEFHTQAMAAIGADTSSNSPFYFVFRQLIHMRGPEGLTINLYELNQFASFCDHNLKVIVPVRSMAPGNPGEKTGEKLVHSIAKTNGRSVTYDKVFQTPSPTPSPYVPSPSRNVADNADASVPSTASSVSSDGTMGVTIGGRRSKRRYKKAYSRRRFKLF